MIDEQACKGHAPDPKGPHMIRFVKKKTFRVRFALVAFMMVLLSSITLVAPQAHAYPSTCSTWPGHTWNGTVMASGRCLTGSGYYKVAVRFVDGITGAKYWRYGPVVKVPSTSTIAARGWLDWIDYRTVQKL